MSKALLYKFVYLVCFGASVMAIIYGDINGTLWEQALIIEGLVVMVILVVLEMWRCCATETYSAYVMYTRKPTPDELESIALNSHSQKPDDGYVIVFPPIIA